MQAVNAKCPIIVPCPIIVAAGSISQASVVPITYRFKINFG